MYVGHPYGPYVFSENADYNNSNSLSIGISNDQVGSPTNGLEVMYVYDNPAVLNAAAVLVTSRSTAYTEGETSFVVQGAGYVGVQRDVISRTDPGTTANIKWTNSSGNVAVGDSVGSIVLGGGAGTTPPTPVSRLTTANVTRNHNGPIYGTSLAVSPGTTRNVLNATGTAFGGDLFLFGGRGEQTIGTIFPVFRYGNVFIGRDPMNSLNIDAQVKIFGRISMFDNEPLNQNQHINTWTKKTSLDVNQTGANSLRFNWEPITEDGYEKSAIYFVNSGSLMLSPYNNDPVSKAVFELPAADHDRLLYFNNGGTNAIGSQLRVQFATEDGYGDDRWWTVGRWYDRPRADDMIYYSGNVIIPAGTYCRLLVQGTESSLAAGLPGASTPSAADKFGISLTLIKFGNS
jgi:hypothetical protein